MFPHLNTCSGQSTSMTSSEHGFETSLIRGSISDSGSDRNLGYDDNISDNLFVSPTGAMDNFSVLDEPIGVMSAKAEKAPNENTMVLAAVCGTIQTCATAYSILLYTNMYCSIQPYTNSGHTQHSWICRGSGIYGTIRHYNASIH